MNSDLRRILSIERVEKPSEWPAWIERSVTRPGASRSLRDVQAHMLWAAHEAQGLLANAGVGWGKTLVTLTLPEVLESKSALLIVPPNALEKTISDAFDYDDDFYVSRDLEVMSSGILSHIDYDDVLFDLAPDLIIVDEAHELSNIKSLRSKRLHAYMSKNPDTRVCAMTGTFIKSTLADYAHIAAWALKHNSPLPLTYTLLETWRLCIDPPSSFEWPQRHDWERMQPLVDAFGDGQRLLRRKVEERRTACRTAYFERLKATPGVVLTEEGSTECPLHLERVEIKVPEVIEQALEKLEESWELPGGEFLKTATEMARARRQLSLGFYYKWAWPGGKKDFAWLDARRQWSAELRQLVGRRGLNSPGLVERDLRKTMIMVLAAMKYGQGDRSRFATRLLLSAMPGMLMDDMTFELWLEWLPQSHKPVPSTKTIWLTTEVLEQVIRRAGDDCLIWYSHKAVAAKLAELGVEVVPAGQTPPKEGPVRTLGLSLQGHHAIHNMQLWSKNLVLCPSRSALVNEQMIGRTHRSMTRASRVYVGFLCHTVTLNEAVDEALARARLARETKGLPQKLLEGKWLKK